MARMTRRVLVRRAWGNVIRRACSLMGKYFGRSLIFFLNKNSEVVPAMDTTNDEGKNNETVIDAQDSKEEESDNESESEEQKISVEEPVVGAQGSKEEKIDMNYDSEGEKKSSDGDESEIERVEDIEVGPLWDHNHARQRARQYEKETGKRWTGAWNTTIPGVMSVIQVSNMCDDTTLLQRAIEEGDVEIVIEILRREEGGRQLRATYGGAPANPKYPDGRDLYARTSPVLHAARRGNVSVFLAVFDAMRDKLKTQVWKSKMKATDVVGRNLLDMASLSGHKDAFDSVLGHLRTYLLPSEVQNMMGSRDKRNRLLMALVAQVRSLPLIDHVYTALETNERMGNILNMRDESRRSLLAIAAESGNETAFQDVLHIVQNIISLEEMTTLLTSRDNNDRSVVASAVKGGSQFLFNNVLATLRKFLEPAKVREIIAKDIVTGPMLVMAARNGRDAFLAVLGSLQNNSILSSSEVQALMMSKDMTGRSLIVAAVESGNKETFSVVLTAVTDMLPQEQVGTMIKNTGGQKSSLLARAAKTGSKELFLAVKEKLETVMTEMEVYEHIAPEAFLECDLLLTALKIDLATEGTESLGLLKKVLGLVGEHLDCDEMMTSSADSRPAAAAQNEGFPSNGIADPPGEASRPNAAPADRTQENLPALSMASSADSRPAAADEGFPSNDIADPPGEASRSNVAPADRTQENIPAHPVREIVCGQVLCWAIQFFEIELFLMTPKYVEKKHVDKKAAGVLCDIFSGWADKFPNKYETNYDTKAIESKVKGLVCEFLDHLASKDKLLDWLRTCLAGPLVSSKNPFANGMVLSVVLARAAGVASEGERRNLLSLHNCVKEFLLEVLERLPQTVMGFQGGMRDCNRMFSVKVQGKQSPLGMMVKRREQRQIYCMAPLVMDFLTRRFSRSLPDLRDDGDILSDKEELASLATYILDAPGARSSIQDSNANNTNRPVLLGKEKLLKHMSDRVAFLQGGNADLPGLAGIPLFGGLPGLQFIVAGLLGKPSSYYRVPAMRMAMHFVVYIVMLVLFNEWILLRDDVALAWQEIFFFVAFVAAGIVREGYELARDLDAYFSDGWNILDLLGLTVLLGAFIVRCADSDSPWGHTLYALSAPLICSRVLFFAQILRFQGPMIQVIFSMMGKLIQFGVIMVVVILGFVMAFNALFLDVYSEGDTWRNLFKAMLGDVELFDVFENETKDGVATALLVVYLLVIAIVLLNLLIAVLSTSHSMIEKNAEQEFRDAKIRIFQFYETAVEKKLFPAPFNLLQLFFTFPFEVVDFVLPNSDRACSLRASECFGQLVFRLVLSPVALAVGVILWWVSSLRAPFAWYTHYSNHPVIVAQCEGHDKQEGNIEKLTPGLVLLRCIAIVFWCIFLAPLWLLFLFLEGLFSNKNDDSSDPEHKDIDVNDMLKKAPGEVGARDLFMHLQDPMNDPVVRTDEKDRQTTVKHVKLLRNRLEATTREEVEQLKKTCRRISAQNDEMKWKLEEIFDMMRQNKTRRGSELDTIAESRRSVSA